jgi:type I restriction enzyme S subunit
MKVHNINLLKLANNSYLRGDFKFVYYYDTIFTKLKTEWKNSVKLRQVISKIRNGKDFSKKAYSDYETNTIYIRVNNLKPLGKFIAEDIAYLKDEKVRAFSDLFVNEGDFLITRSGTVGIAFRFEKSILPEEIRDKDFMPAGYIIVLKIRSKFNDKHFKYFLYSSISRKYLEALSCGKSQQNISQSDLGKWLIPLSLLKNIPDRKIKEKEKQIAVLKSLIKDPRQIVDEVFGKYIGYNLNKFSEFEKKHIFKKSLFDFCKSSQLRNSLKFHYPEYCHIFDILRKYKTVKLKQLLKEPVRRGVQPEYDENGEIPVIKTLNVNKDGYIDLSELKYVNNQFYEQVKKKAGIQKGDILITSTGEGRGKVCFYNLDEPAIADTHVSIVRSKGINPKYLTYFLLSALGKSQLSLLEQAVKGTPEIYSEEIGQLIIIYPDAEKQKQIIEEIEQKLEKQRKINEEINKLETEIDKLIEKAVFKN